MGFFSWLTADTKESIANRYTNHGNCNKPVYMLQPLGLPPIKEGSYSGYGEFGGVDAHAWLAHMNLGEEVLSMDHEEMRLAGIKIQNEKTLKYPLKFSFDPSAIYEELSASKECPNQGYFYRSNDGYCASRIVVVNGYLTQKKMVDLFKEMFGENFIKSEMNIPGTRMRFDLAFIRDGQQIVVEFDGDEHYRNPIKIERDLVKDELAKSLGWEVVRVPYWLQLSREVYRQLFGCIDVEIETDFPDGFITTKYFPASFCEWGTMRFFHEFENLPLETQMDVFLSLLDRMKDHNKMCVLSCEQHEMFYDFWNKKTNIDPEIVEWKLQYKEEREDNQMCE